MSSRRALILDGIESSLEGINGAGSYHNTLTAAKVQREGAYVNVDEIVDPPQNDRPLIQIQVLDDVGEPDTEGSLAYTLTVQMTWLPRSSLTAAQLEDVVEDVKRALAVGIATGFGAGTRNERLTNSTIDPESGLPLGGVQFVLTLTYTEAFGDPASTGD